MSDAGTVSFDKPIAFSHQYPSPRFPAYPSITVDHPGSRPPPPGTQATLHAARARYALALVAANCLAPGSRVLLPAYHCPAMVEPFIWAGCSIKFYGMDNALRPVVGDSDLHGAAAILLTRYFGFDPGLGTPASRARQEGLLVIEDLAHAAYADELIGDVGVTSLAKFFPQRIGAELFFREGQRAGKVSKKIADIAASPLGWHITRLWTKVRHRYRQLRKRPGRQRARRYRYFEENELSRPTHQCRHSARSDAITSDCRARRRENYRLLLDASTESTLGSPLYPTLDEKTVPCVFPFLLNRAEDFDHFRNAGIPLFRWEELVLTDCTVSRHYRSRLIQIPCHQDLRPEDLELIKQCLTRIVKDNPV